MVLYFATHTIAGLILICLGLYVRRARRTRAALAKFMAAYRCGDYETALRITDDLLKGQNAKAYWTLRGGTLMQLGRLDEAERDLKKAVDPQSPARPAPRDSGGGPSATRALDLEVLGQVYVEKACYDEALKCFEAGVALSPRTGSIYRSIAEVNLRRRDSPSEAVKWATLALDKDRSNEDLPLEDLNGNDIAVDLATLAWAMAANVGDRTCVEKLASEAVNAAADLPVSDAAQIYFQAGLAYSMVGEVARSIQHLTEAARIDPHGRWGRAAQAKAVHEGAAIRSELA